MASHASRYATAFDNGLLPEPPWTVRNLTRSRKAQLFGRGRRNRSWRVGCCGTERAVGVQSRRQRQGGGLPDRPTGVHELSGGRMGRVRADSMDLLTGPLLEDAAAFGRILGEDGRSGR